MAEFIRNHAFLTFIIFLIVIVAGNVAMFMRSKNPDKNIKDWFMMKNASETLGDPWKKETDQLSELSERVATLQKEKEIESETN
jgi:hypothetical protein